MPFDNCREGGVRSANADRGTVLPFITTKPSFLQLLVCLLSFLADILTSVL